ncbi:hypothetical protein HZB96_00885 [Candidatus Gottesmanbacteria bacterium]|nr:hypothetical protein [Candidatus Gottesmanbacteria bacterium]MBI5452228.1 hypothetical protein [Candidatus Gottesmanbacteria bacterium]
MKKKLSVKKISFEVFGSLADLLIWQIALVGASFGQSGSRGVYQAFREADEVLSEINHHTLAATWHQLFKKRLLTYKKRENLYSVEITKFGLGRLKSQIPIYHKKRPWDGKVYLITYDIPEQKSNKRYLLRSILKRLKATPLQESVWLIPYNPREILNDFVNKNNIKASIIVSDIGKDGGIGETDIHDLLIKVYKLESLNEKYEKFMKKARSGKINLKYLLLEYLSILKDDPQLPFGLLPRGWLGYKAYELYMRILPKKFSI